MTASHGNERSLKTAALLAVPGFASRPAANRYLDCQPRRRRRVLT